MTNQMMAGVMSAVAMMVAVAAQGSVAQASECRSPEIAASIGTMKQELAKVRSSRAPGFEEAPVLQAETLLNAAKTGGSAQVAQTVSDYLNQVRSNNQGLTQWVLKSNIETLANVCEMVAPAQPATSVATVMLLMTFFAGFMAWTALSRVKRPVAQVIPFPTNTQKVSHKTAA